MERMLWERNTVEKMLALYCKHHHGYETGGNLLCADCNDLLLFAFKRIDACPYGTEKPPCSLCTTHCYAPKYRERIKEVMRYSGPRMLFHHPLTAVIYLWRKLVFRQSSVGNG